MEDYGNRLEALWGGQFGDQYSERNDNPFADREPFWKHVLELAEVKSVLEIGCNVGTNLQWISRHLPGGRLSGIDINRSALEKARQKLPDAELLQGSAADLPFPDEHFDLVFTAGVLIHLSSETLPAVMAEAVRCSKRYVLCGEYFAEERTEIPYRDQEGALFKDNFGRRYLDSFPALKLVETGFLAKTKDGWDDITYWLFEKGRG